MVVTVNKETTKRELYELLAKLELASWRKRKKNKSENLKKAFGLLKHLDKSPIEIQKELRDEWGD